jgi:type II restriction/modification system DNA methylase subunit YeeA
MLFIISKLSGLKVLDPAMGSGSFLLRAFDHLLDCYTRYNRACRDIKQAGRIRNTPGELFGERYEVAEEVFNPAFYIPPENIFGADLDPQAVELSRLNLWMRLMIAERDLMRERLRLRQPDGLRLHGSNHFDYGTAARSLWTRKCPFLISER